MRRIAPCLPQADQQNQTVIDALAQVAMAYAAGGYQVICDGIVRSWFIDVFRTAADAQAIPLYYVILRRDGAAPSAPRAGTRRFAPSRRSTGRGDRSPAPASS
jgi:hypothetical protein